MAPANTTPYLHTPLARVVGYPEGGLSLDLDTYIPSGPGAIVARIIPTYPQDLHPVIPIPPKISIPAVGGHPPTLA